jgi:hypothetical protein
MKIKLHSGHFLFGNWIIQGLSEKRGNNHRYFCSSTLFHLPAEWNLGNGRDTQLFASGATFAITINLKNHMTPI